MDLDKVIAIDINGNVFIFVRDIIMNMAEDIGI